MPLDPLPPTQHATFRLTRQRPLKLRRRRRYQPQVNQYVTLERRPHPVSVDYALALGDLYGRGIRGLVGTISTGSSRGRGGHVADPSAGFAGYAQPPQLFTGWNPAYQTAVGTPLKGPSGLPDTSAPLGSTSPMDSAMNQIMAGSA